MAAIRLSSRGWTIVVSVGIMLALIIGILEPVRGVATRVVAPVGQVAYQVFQWVDGRLAQRQTTKDAQAALARLQEQLTETQRALAQAQQQLVDLHLVRTEKAFIEGRHLQGIPVHVIGRSSVNAQELLVDAGGQQGIRQGAAVLAPAGVLVGMVREVAESTASIQLLTSSSTNVAVRTRKPDGPPGIVVGERGTGLRLTLVPQNEELKSGDLVITADVQPSIPSGLLVGSITNIDAQPGALFQSATVLPATAYDRLSVLTVLVQ
ncbi:MAG: rod shape-determining protein MreC [Patescibacteria group bacterium]|jgi:rod shape-determining protein MreC